jgi:hypothetical protein
MKDELYMRSVMHVPIRSFKFVGMEVHEYKHKHNPSESKEFEENFIDGYYEIELIFNQDHWFINPCVFRILLVHPIKAADQTLYGENLIVMTMYPFEKYIGFAHTVDHERVTDVSIGGDIFALATCKVDGSKRTRGFVVQHDKGILVPEEMFGN